MGQERAPLIAASGISLNSVLRERRHVSIPCLLESVIGLNGVEEIERL
jgi:hypothetical protein